MNGTSQLSGYVFPSADLSSGDEVLVRVALLDVSKMDVSAVVISEDEFLTKSSWPLLYILPYDEQVLQQRLTYGVSVRVSTSDGELLAINDVAHQFSVISDNKQFDILVKPVRARVTSLAEIDIVCAEVGYRISIYKDFLVRYNKRSQSRQIFIQKRSGSGSRYERDSEALLLKGNLPPLYLKDEENFKCSISAKE